MSSQQNDWVVLDRCVWVRRLNERPNPSYVVMHKREEENSQQNVNKHRLKLAVKLFPPSRQWFIVASRCLQSSRRGSWKQEKSLTFTSDSRVWHSCATRGSYDLCLTNFVFNSIISSLSLSLKLSLSVSSIYLSDNKTFLTNSEKR